MAHLHKAPATTGNLSDLIGDMITKQPYLQFSQPIGPNNATAIGTDAIYREIGVLLKEYNNALIDKGLMLRRRDLKTKDIIDLRDALTYDEQSYDEYHKAANLKHDEAAGMQLPDFPINEEIDEFFIENSWYSFIPCFNEGVIQLNKARYIHYEILKMDIPNTTIDIRLHDYMQAQGIWQIGVQTTIHYDFSHLPQTKDEYSWIKHFKTAMKQEIANGKPEKQVWEAVYDYIIFAFNKKTTTDNDIVYDALYQQIPFEELKWNKQSQTLWTDIVIAYAKAEKEKRFNDNGGTAAQDMFYIFQRMIFWSNYLLSKNKPKAVRSGNQYKKYTTIPEPGANQPRKLVRNVGNMHVTSVKPPKLPTQETVIHYKTAVWKARGGVRRLKNGKLVPFKECTKHRKCLQKTNAIPQSVVRLHNQPNIQNETRKETDA